MENLAIYEAFRAVPEGALKTITGGNLAGKSDINPVWRIKMLTERFGPCGFGWYTRTAEHWLDEKTIDGKTEIVAWVRIELYVNLGGGEWSQPIEGIGGSKYAGKGRGGELNDEAFKMAETDAISVACKKLGMAADIYWQTDNTKYTTGTAPTKAKTKAKPAAEQPTSDAKMVPVSMNPEDGKWREWIKQAAAAGRTREWCEARANTRNRTITSDVWEQCIETSF